MPITLIARKRLNVSGLLDMSWHNDDQHILFLLCVKNVSLIQETCAKASFPGKALFINDQTSDGSFALPVIFKNLADYLEVL